MATVQSTKYIGIKYDSGIDSTTQMSRTYNNTIEDATKLSVSYNGQRIIQRISETVSTTNQFAKFYYELTIGPSSFTITVHSNPHYRRGELDVTQAEASCNIHPDDLFYVEYTYTYTV